MPLRYVRRVFFVFPLALCSGQQKAKAHVFLDVGMDEVTKPTRDCDVRAGAGCKVVITIGPSCQNVDVLEQLLRAGVTCARINLSWGTKEYHARSLANLGEAMKRTRRLCCVFVDTCGREVTVRRAVEYDELGWPRQTGDTRVKVARGQAITITTDPEAACSDTVFPVNYPGFPAIVSPGFQLQIGRFLATGADGGSLFLTVTDTTETTVTCTALNDATLDGLLTVMICHEEDEDFRGDFGLPLLTEHDIECLKYLGSKFEIDFVDLSYCNQEEDLYRARAFLDGLGMQQTKLVAKIERKSAVRNFEGIAHVADAIVISRGNLGLDFEPEMMALLQKRIISRCNQMGKPVLMTRFVDTMVDTPRPTRAEATDVANAVLDGVDGLLLGAETLRGLHPVLTVETVLKLCYAAEAHFDYRTHHEMLMGEAYEEEVSLEHGHSSVSDFGMFGRQNSLGASAQPPYGGAGGPYGGAGGPYGGPYSGAYGNGGGRSGGPEGSVHTLHQHRAPTPPLEEDDGEGQPGARSHRSPPAAAAAGPNGRAGSASPGMPGSAFVPASRGAGFGSGMPPRHGGPSQAQPYVSEFGSLLPRGAGSSQHLNYILLTHAPYMTKLESLASSATRTAEKINAGLIIVMVQSGRTVSLVSKYRPPMPIMAVVVPRLKSTTLGWQLEGKFLARQTCILRGVVPMLAAPMSDGSEELIDEAVHAAYMQRLVKPRQYVVVMKSVRGNMMVKVVQVNSSGTGTRSMTGGNSSGGGDEEPDIISEASPFGEYVIPTSPSANPGAGVLSPGLSGRASLLPSSPTQRTITLGAPSSTLLGATLSEAYDRPHPAANSRRSRLSSDS